MSTDAIGNEADFEDERMCKSSEENALLTKERLHKEDGVGSHELMIAHNEQGSSIGQTVQSLDNPKQMLSEKDRDGSDLYVFSVGVE